jgi:hypothetical protein
MKTLFAKLVSNRGIYYLLLIVTLGVLVAAEFKWAP